MTSNEKVLCVAPFPPPVHGFSIASLNLVNELNKKYTTYRYDVSSKFNIFKYLVASFVIIKFSISKGKKLSLGCNGGMGKIYTLLLIVIASIVNLNVTLHHHSYSYINNYSSVMRLITLCLDKKSKHIFLSNKMYIDFRDMYGFIDYQIIQNAFFIPKKEPRPSNKNIFSIGLLSNLNREKGLHRFLEIVTDLEKNDMNFQALLAGPIDTAEDKKLVKLKLKELKSLKYIGPVYDNDKDEFFANLDLFIFPTTYHNEAQPIVIYEAMSYGVPVFSNNKGSIKEQVGKAGKVFDNISHFDNDIVKNLIEIMDNKKYLLDGMKKSASIKLEKDSEAAKLTIAKLFNE